jgi:hypothetical protein
LLVGAIAIGLLDRRQPMPFYSPFLAIGGSNYSFVGRSDSSTYLQLFFPNFSF